MVLEWQTLLQLRRGLQQQWGRCLGCDNSDFSDLVDWQLGLDGPSAAASSSTSADGFSWQLGHDGGCEQQILLQLQLVDFSNSGNVVGSLSKGFFLSFSDWLGWQLGQIVLEWRILLQLQQETSATVGTLFDVTTCDFSDWLIGSWARWSLSGGFFFSFSRDFSNSGDVVRCFNIDFSDWLVGSWAGWSLSGSFFFGFRSLLVSRSLLST